MAKSVNDAFNEFNTNTVNLDPTRTAKARGSRDWLITQLTNLPSKIDDFPSLYDGMHIKFGSFARNTKIRPLDDIDLILTFGAQGSSYETILSGKDYKIIVPETAKDLRKLCDKVNILNSTRVVNKLVSSLNNIDQYKSAEIHRRQEAATLKLNSYEWNFDIVPAFYTDTQYYLIPDGKGGWKATDPRIDQNRVSAINQKHGGKILQIIRTLKYWNKTASMPTIGSYLFENLALKYFDKDDTEVSKWIDINIINFWDYLKDEIFNPVLDPKGFQGDINCLIYEDRKKISAKAKDAYIKGYNAYKIETEEINQEKAINKWREIFGNEFPKYE